MSEAGPAHARRAAWTLGVVALAAGASLAACGASGSDASRTDSRSSTTIAAAGTRTGTDLRGERYCEVLLLNPGPGGLVADVYNTYGLNDCPQSEWEQLDASELAVENDVTLANLNGPRYWLMDTVEQLDTGEQPHKTFGALEMIQRATVAIADPVTAQQPYTVNSVDRAASFTFGAGSTVYEITDADGAAYVMQSWSQERDPNLDEAALAGLGSRLALPAGWTYGARRLDAALRVDTTAAVAQVIQDEFRNSYSMLAS